MKIAITGANSSVGINLLEQLSTQSDMEVIAGVRTEKAFSSLPQATNIEPRVISYTDQEQLQAALAGAEVVIHLAGILIEQRHSNYASANVAATAAVLEASQTVGARHFIFISVVGADPDSGNAYFRSKGVAEQLALAAPLTTTVLRTPILLGRGTAGAISMLNTARRQQAKLLGGGHYLMRPLDIDDLSRAIIKLSQAPAERDRSFELVGPEGLPYRDLISKLAQKMGHEIELGSAPVWLAKCLAGARSIVKGGGMTPSVIDVITRDEKVSHNNAGELGVELTPLDTTLDKMLETQEARQ